MPRTDLTRVIIVTVGTVGIIVVLAAAVFVIFA